MLSLHLEFEISVICKNTFLSAMQTYNNFMGMVTNFFLLMLINFLLKSSFSLCMEPEASTILWKSILIMVIYFTVRIHIGWYFARIRCRNRLVVDLRSFKSLKLEN